MKRGCDRLRSSRKIRHPFFSDSPGSQVLRPLRYSAATGKQLSRVHIRHLHLTAILVSPLRRVTTEPALGLSGGGSCDRHISSVGAGLARDAGTSFCLDDRRAGIAGKPAPTRDWWCLCSHAIVQTTRMPLTEGRAQVLLWGARQDAAPAAMGRPTGRPVGVSACCAIFVAADERSEAAIGCEAVAKSDTRFFQIAQGLRFYGRFATQQQQENS